MRSSFSAECVPRFSTYHPDRYADLEVMLKHYHPTIALERVDGVMLVPLKRDRLGMILFDAEGLATDVFVLRT